MPRYKKQHFLPLAYLSNFSRPPESAPRKRSIWRFSRNQSGLVPVKTQCQKDWFYSKKRSKLAEEYFGKLETIIGRLIQSLESQTTFPHELLFLFFLSAVDFYIRSHKFKANDSLDEFELYLKRIQIFTNMLISESLVDSDDNARRQYILDNWQFSFVVFENDNALLTSDSPSLWLGSSKSPSGLRGTLLPITPLCYFVGVHKKFYKITDSVGSPNDANILNINQIENCVDAVFSSDALTGEQKANVQRRLAKAGTNPALSDGWAVEYIDYDLEPTLSFLDTT